MCNFGGYAPILLILLSWFLLWDYKNLFFYYNIGLVTNSIFNSVLKGLIKQPRPSFDNKKIQLITKHNKGYFYQNGIPFDIYGMPSGHAQMAFFTIIFMYLSLRYTNYLYIYIIISLFICYQRINCGFHSTSQVFVGMFVGLIFGTLVYYLSREKIKGKIREKYDDNAKI